MGDRRRVVPTAGPCAGGRSSSKDLSRKRGARWGCLEASPETSQAGRGSPLVLRVPDARNPTVGPQRGAANVSDGRGTSLSLAEARKAEGGIQGQASSASAAASLTGLERLAQTWEHSCRRAPC